MTRQIIMKGRRQLLGDNPTENSRGQTHTITIPDFACMRHSMRQDIVLELDNGRNTDSVVVASISDAHVSETRYGIPCFVIPLSFGIT